MPGLNADEIRHTEQIVYGIVNAKYDALTIKVDSLRSELLSAIDKPRHCPAHGDMVMAVHDLEEASKRMAARRQILPTWVQVIIAACVGLSTIVWLWTQFAMAITKP